jgi:hypothetical protein
VKKKKRETTTHPSKERIETLKIHGSFEDVLKASVSGNPKPKRKGKKNKD